MTKSKLYSYFNYFYIAIVLLWRPLQGTILTVDGKGRILLLLTIIALLINCNRIVFRKILYKQPIVIWLLWCIYVIINTYLSGFYREDVSFLYFAINQICCPCIIMAVIAFEYFKDDRKLLKYVLFIFLIYAFIGAFVMDIGYVAAEEDAVNVNTLGNALALNVMMIIFFTGLCYCRKELSLKITVVLILFAMGIIVMSATRKALGAGVLMIIALMLSQIKISINSLIKMMVPIIALYFAFTYVMNNTGMGKRLSELDDQADNVSLYYNVSDNVFLKSLGDRAPQYILGTQLFVEQPITGIGLTNFQRKSGYPNRLHSEYMVQICECGIIGCILFVMFYIYIIKQLLLKFRKGNYDRQIVVIMLGTIVALLFIYLTTWSYSNCVYFTVLGTIIGYIYKK